jgi:hypothetical protein
MLYFGNAFSLQMVDGDCNISIRNIGIEDVFDFLKNNPGFKSCVGHADTASVLSNMLGTEIPSNRINITLHEGDNLIVAQVMGGRLPEGATTLPENCTIKFMMVTII